MPTSQARCKRFLLHRKIRGEQGGRDRGQERENGEDLGSISLKKSFPARHQMSSASGSPFNPRH